MANLLVGGVMQNLLAGDAIAKQSRQVAGELNRAKNEGDAEKASKLLGQITENYNKGIEIGNDVQSALAEAEAKAKEEQEAELERAREKKEQLEESQAEAIEKIEARKAETIEAIEAAGERSAAIAERIAPQPEHPAATIDISREYKENAAPESGEAAGPRPVPQIEPQIYKPPAHTEPQAPAPEYKAPATTAKPTTVAATPPPPTFTKTV
jgi:hypothetical protein